MAAALFSQVRLELDVAKTGVWRPDGRAASLPDGAGAWVADALPCLGSAVIFAGARPDEGDDEWRGTRAEILDQTSPAAAAPRPAAFGDALEDLRAAGPAKQRCFALLRQRRVTHLRRARLAPRGRWRSFDDGVVVQIERLAGPGFTANGREVLRAGQAAPGLAWAEEAAPELTAAVSEAKARLRADGAWVPWGSRCVVKQRTCSRRVVGRRRRWFLDRASPGLKRGSSSPMAGRRLLGNDEFAAALRRRLLYEDPAGTGGRPCCNAARGTALQCGASAREPLAVRADERPAGPGFARRHDGARGALGEWLVERHGQNAVGFERRIPTLGRRAGEGIQRAALDAVLAHPGGRAWCDVGVAEGLPAAAAEGAGEALGGAALPGRRADRPSAPDGPDTAAHIHETAAQTVKGAKQLWGNLSGLWREAQSAVADQIATLQGGE
ncbi:unnamed protein product, partial [Prorocentrum cordatum]